MNPRDRAKDSARVIDLDAYRREKFDREAMSVANDPMTAPGDMHPAARYLAAQQKQVEDLEEAKKDKEFSEKFDIKDPMGE